MRFSELEVGQKFRITLDWEAGIDIVYLKTSDAPSGHNAVKVDYPDNPLTISLKFKVTVVD